MVTHDTLIILLGVISVVLLLAILLAILRWTRMWTLQQRHWNQIVNGGAGPLGLPTLFDVMVRVCGMMEQKMMKDGWTFEDAISGCEKHVDKMVFPSAENIMC